MPVFECRLLRGTAATYKAGLKEVRNEGLYLATIIIIIIIVIIDLHLSVGPWPQHNGNDSSKILPPPRAEKYK
jgi:hypothetical protein